MRNIIVNFDESWDFGALMRRYLLHWYPSVGRSRLMLCRKSARYAEAPGMMNWPLSVDDDRFKRILINCKAAGEFTQLKVATLIASASTLTNENKALFFTAENSTKSTRHCLFLHRSDSLPHVPELEALLTDGEHSPGFDFIFIVPTDSVRRLKSIALVNELLVENNLFHNDFLRDTQSKNRIIEIDSEDLDDASVNQYDTAYEQTFGLLKSWLLKTTKALDVDSVMSAERLVAGTLDFQKTSDERSLGIEQKLGDLAPDSSLLLPELFFESSYFDSLESQIKQFDTQLDNYLENWFAQLNRHFSTFRRSFRDKQRNRLDTLSELLQPLSGTPTDVLTDSLEIIDQAIDRRRMEISGLLDKIQADFTPQTKLSVRWNSQQNKGFHRIFFSQEEEAVDRAFDAIQLPWRLQAVRSFFWFALVLVVILAAVPLIILRVNEPGLVPYWQNYSVWVMDSTWMLLWILPALAGLYISARERRNILRRAVAQTSEALAALLDRHQQACNAAEKYSVVRTYLQELGLVKEYLQDTIKKKWAASRQIDKINDLLIGFNSEKTVSSIEKPDNMSDWVKVAIQKCFKVPEVSTMQILNTLAPDQKTITVPSYLPNKLTITRYLPSFSD
ncbi:MAG: hypothetical protein V3U75_12010 [Methylococcaceae bacterium]